MRTLKDLTIAFAFAAILALVVGAHLMIPTRDCNIEECITDRQGFMIVWGATMIGAILGVILLRKLAKGS